MSSNDKQVLERIAQHIRLVLQYCKECRSLEDFQSDTMRVDACVFNLMQIGELAKMSLSEECKQELKSIPWKQLYGMRNRIVHGYSGVNMRIVWDTIQEDLPALANEIYSIL